MTLLPRDCVKKMAANNNLATRLLVVLLFLFSSLAVHAESLSPDDLFKKGWTLYQQHNTAEALEILSEAAEAGHAEAAYYAGEIVRQTHVFMTDKAFKWYRLAAEGGDPYAMVRLANVDFCGITSECADNDRFLLDKALELEKPKAESGDTEAMKALSTIYAAKGNERAFWKWLLRAGEAGHVYSQYFIGTRIRDGQGFYWTDSGRQKDVMKWFRQAAEDEYPPAMLGLAGQLLKQERYKKAWSWVEKAANTDYMDAAVVYGYGLMGGVESIYKLNNDRIKEGYAVLSALRRFTNDPSMPRALEAYGYKLTKAEITEAKAMAEKLYRDVDLIYYMPKFGL